MLGVDYLDYTGSDIVSTVTKKSEAFRDREARDWAVPSVRLRLLKPCKTMFCAEFCIQNLFRLD